MGVTRMWDEQNHHGGCGICIYHNLGSECRALQPTLSLSLRNLHYIHCIALDRALPFPFHHNESPSPPLPRIACFHGGGSNGLVFASQCKRLQHLLAHEYEFVFFDAPFEREAGPGVLPYFKDLAPFRTWMRPEYFDDDESEGLKRVVQLMTDDTVRRQRSKAQVCKREREMGREKKGR
jgi:hypothetical protein